MGRTTSSINISYGPPHGRPLLSKYRQEMDAAKLLIYLQRIYYARVLFVCIVCIRQFRLSTCILLSALISTDISCHHFPVKGYYNYWFLF